MAFTTLVLKEMIIKSTALLILIHLIIIEVAHGYLGCPNNLVPCSSKAPCVEIEKVCVDYHDCVNEQGNLTCNHCSVDQRNSIACVTLAESHITFECLSPNKICDGTKNCANNEDEDLCGIQKCNIDSWLCKNGTCIERHRLCDRSRDCPDGSDEGEFCHQRMCGPDQIHCPTGECIPKSKMCDNIPHCSDGYDELNCLHVTSATIRDSCSISSNKFHCSASAHPICISNDRVCDGYKDCPMGDDEHDCSNKCTSRSRYIENPDVTCIQHPQADRLYRCMKQGYRLAPNSYIPTCQDFDECNDSLGTYCSFNCINTDGSFNCACPVDFSIDEESKTCRQINDPIKPNLLILFDDKVVFYNIWNNTKDYSLKLLNQIYIGKDLRYDHIQYDPNQMFVIYYDQDKLAMLCKSSITLKTITLVSNIIAQSFAYNANEKTLFIIEDRTLRMYTSITCSVSSQIKMHSWTLNNTLPSIQSMEIDVYNRRIIFASHYEFMISYMSEPNSTKTVYSTDQKIKRFIYDTSFKRIFWTTINETNNNGLFPVYTCDDEFKQCQDTSIALPGAWPFAFFNDGLLHTSPLSLKSIDIIQLYGKDRFSNNFVTSTKENIHSFLSLNHHQTELLSLCMNSSISPCQNEICLQINLTDFNCLSIDENITSTQFITPDDMNSDLQKGIETPIDDDDNLSQTGKQQHRYRLSNKMLFSLIIIGVVVAVLAFFAKRYHKRLSRKGLDHERNQNRQCFATDEPNLDEFNVMIDDRVSKHREDYALEILFAYPTILLIGHRRSSI